MNTNIYSVLMMACFTTVTWAQAPDMFNYQAMALDGSGTVYKNHTLDVRMTIFENSSGR